MADISTEKVIRQVQIGTDLYDIAAKYIQTTTAGEGKTWQDILDLLSTAFQVKVEDSLPSISSMDDAKFKEYKSSIVLVRDSAGAGQDIFDEFIINGNDKASATWEQIGTTKTDLSDYAKKAVAKELNTSSTELTTESAGAETAVGTATISYDKAVQANAAGEATIDGSNFSAALPTISISTSGKYDKATGITGSTTVAAHSHSVTFASTPVTYVTGANAEDKVSVVTGITGGTASGATDVIPSYTHSDPVFATVSVVTAVGDVGSAGAHTHAVDSHEHAADESVLTGVSSFSGGSITTTQFNTDAIKSAGLSVADTTSAGAAQYVESISAPSVTLGGNATPMKTATVSNGVLSWTTEAVTASASGAEATTKYLNVTTTAAAKAAVGFTAATISFSTASVAGAASAKTLTAASAGAHTHAISGGAATYVLEKVATAGKITGAEKVSVVTGVTAAAVSGTTSVIASLQTASFNNVTGATLDAKGGFTISGDDFSISNAATDITLTGSIAAATLEVSGSQTIASHTHGINTTPTAATGTASVAVSAHTHSIAGHTHTVASHEHPTA